MLSCLGHLEMGLDVHREVAQEVWTLKDPSQGKKKASSWKKKTTFYLLSFLPMGRGLDPKLHVLFTLLISGPNIRSLFPHHSAVITYSLWFSADLFLCSYGQTEFWDSFSQKTSIVKKEGIFHVKTILKVVRDRSGLWCSRKISNWN